MRVRTRQNVFETNSSTTHQLCIMKTSDFNKWSEGNSYYYDPYNYKWELEHDYLDKDYQPIPKKVYTEDEVRNFLMHNSSIEVKDFDFESDECSYDDLEDLAYENQFYSIEKFDQEYEIDEDTFVTENGEQYTVHCAYGYNY